MRLSVGISRVATKLRLVRQLTLFHPRVLRVNIQDYIDAPLPCVGKSDVEGVFDGPYYEWFRYNKVHLILLALHFRNINMLCSGLHTDILYRKIIM